METEKKNIPLGIAPLVAIASMIEGHSEVGRIIDGEFQPFDGVRLESLVVQTGRSSRYEARITLTDTARPSDKTGIQFPEPPAENPLRHLMDAEDRKRFEEAAKGAIGDALVRTIDRERKGMSTLEATTATTEELLTELEALREQHIEGL